MSKGHGRAAPDTCSCCGTPIKPTFPEYSGKGLCLMCWAARHPEPIADCCKRAIERSVDAIEAHVQTTDLCPSYRALRAALDKLDTPSPEHPQG